MGLEDVVAFYGLFKAKEKRHTHREKDSERRANCFNMESVKGHIKE